MANSELIPVANPLAQRVALKVEIDEAVQRVLASGYYVLGPELEALETEFADYIGVSHSVGVANGTDAIALALRALGLGPGDEVITVSFTAVATVAGIEMAGCKPVLVDVEAGYFTLDPASLEEAFTERTRAVVVVHLYGQSADLDRIQEFCDRTGVALIEDVSQAHGSRWRGRRTGSFGVVSTFSCYPTKNLGAIGDAGILATSDKAIADRVRRLRQYGWETRNESLEAGVNSRLDELQAAILRIKLRGLDDSNAKRQAIAARYSGALVDSYVSPPSMRPQAQHVFHLYVIEVAQRDALRRALADRGVSTAVHYPTPVHLQPAYLGRLRVPVSMKVSDLAANRVLSLPMFPELTSEEVDVVIASVLRSSEKCAEGI